MLDDTQQGWMTKLMGYTFQIKYKPGSANSAADALSRREDSLELNAISVAYVANVEKLDEEIQKEEKLSAILQKLLTGQQVPQGYSVKEGHLLFNGSLTLPRSSTYVPVIMKEFHDSPIGGHTGYLRTYKRMTNLFYWDGMRRDIQAYVKACDICQRNKHSSLSPAGLLQPLPIPDEVWSDISMDFISGLPKSQHYDTIFVAVDRFTKYSHFPFETPLFCFICC